MIGARSEVNEVRELADDGQVAEAWRALGRQLAALRQAAGLRQERFAALTAYSRSTIASVETGRQHASASFWAKCDAVLGTGDSLRRAYEEVQAVEQAHRAEAVALTRYKSLVVTFPQDNTATDGAGRPSAGARAAGEALALEAGSPRDPLVVKTSSACAPGTPSSSAGYAKISAGKAMPCSGKNGRWNGPEKPTTTTSWLTR
jgi:transcriptional regulator with XRE-family HTH domain